MKTITIKFDDDKKAQNVFDILMDIKVFDYEKNQMCLVDVISPEQEANAFGGFQYSFDSCSGITDMEIK